MSSSLLIFYFNRRGSELAFRLKQAGIPVTLTDKKNGYFELDGISKKSLQVYATRSEQIKAYMKAHGVSGAKAAEVATLKTRPAKRALDRETREAHWQEKGRQQQVDTFQEVADLTQTLCTGPTKTPEPASSGMLSTRAPSSVRTFLSHSARSNSNSWVYGHRNCVVAGTNLLQWPVII